MVALTAGPAYWDRPGGLRQENWGNWAIQSLPHLGTCSDVRAALGARLPHPHPTYLLFSGGFTINTGALSHCLDLFRELKSRRIRMSVIPVIPTRWDWERWGMAPQDSTIPAWRQVRESAWKAGTFCEVGIIHPKPPAQCCYKGRPVAGAMNMSLLLEQQAQTSGCVK